MTAHPGTSLVLVALASLTACLDCRRDAPRPSARDPSSGDAPIHSPAGSPPAMLPSTSEINDADLSPSDVIRRINMHRRSGAVMRMERYLEPLQRPMVRELVLSVDRLVAANRTLRGAVEESIGSASAILVDRPDVANIIGVFSHDVEIVDERVDGERAVVEIQVGGRLPLQRVALRRVDGVWIVAADDPIPGLARELGRLADVLLELADRVRRRSMDREELIRELTRREGVVLRRIDALIRSAAEQSGTTEPP